MGLNTVIGTHWGVRLYECLTKLLLQNNFQLAVRLIGRIQYLQGPPLPCLRKFQLEIFAYCRTHNVRVCLYIAYIACGSASLYIKMLYFFLTVLALSAAATVANIKIHFDAKTPQFAIFGTRVMCVIYVFYSI